MPRVKRGFKRRRRVNKLRSQAEGYDLGRRSQYRRMVENIERAGQYAFTHRRKKKRNFRELWISRISAAANSNDLSYSRLVAALIRGQVEINRKMLSDIAIHDPSGFSAIVNQVRSLAPAN